MVENLWVSEVEFVEVEKLVDFELWWVVEYVFCNIEKVYVG